MILCSEQELRRRICRQRIAAALSFAASLLAVLSGVAIAGVIMTLVGTGVFAVFSSQ